MQHHTRLSIVLILCTINILTTKSDISKCKHEQSTFNCSGVGLQNIPDEKDLPPGLKILDLSNNNITAVPFLNFDENVSLSLTQLFLNHNQINMIQNFSFSKLVNLETLDLSYNSLSGSDLNQNTFAHMSALQVLVLDHNILRILRQITFTDIRLPSLRHLSLSHCELTELENFVIGFKTLNVLNLSWNRLNSTSIKDLPIVVMADFDTLDLSHNEFTGLDAVNFPVVYGLKNLILDHNHITRLCLIYASMYQIKTISVRDNNIRTLDNTSLPWHLATLRAIDLRENPIVCDCNMSWLLMDPNVKTKTISIVCDSPSVLKGRNLFDLTPGDINCTDHHDDDQNVLPIVIGTVLAGGVLLVMVGVILVVKRKRRQRNDPWKKLQEQTFTLDTSA